LPTGNDSLDALTGGGFPLGSVTEWGLPLGHGGLELLVRLVGRYTQGPDPMWALVSQAAGGLLVMASAWEARGVNLGRLRLTVSDQPVRDLKPALMQPFFKLIVLYAPTKLSADDCAFLARTARTHKRLVWIVRDGWLTPERGNVWARYRINVKRPAKNAFPNKLNIELVRGMAPRTTSLTLDA
jgi:RecA/RadA recombinase